MMLDAKLLLAIENNLDRIVQRAEQCVIETRADKTGTQDTQFRNLQNMAAATSSVLALKNFINYQIGRGYLDTNVGMRILQDIDNLLSMGEEISTSLGVNGNQKYRVQMELIRLYLGFLTRKIVAERKKQKT